MLRIGVLGAGHLGKIHINLLKDIEAFHLVGFYDPNPENARQAEETYSVPAYPTMDALLDDVDVIDIVTPTLSHFDCACRAIEKGKHFFVEKPLTNTVQEAYELMKRMEGTSIKAQVGHVERFNPAFLAAQQFNLKPMFIEGHRLAEFKPRGTDVSVVLDLMIHDIDIILSIVDAEVEHVSASGVSVISDNVDIANARIEFSNGCVANLTASRISLKTERKLRIFQKNTYITIDFHKKEVNAFKIKELQPGEKPESFIVIDPGDGKPKKELIYSSPTPPDINAIAYELTIFAAAITNDTQPIVTVKDGYKSLRLAQQVLDSIDTLIKKSQVIEKL